VSAILVIDDETNIRRFVAANLSARGYDVAEAVDAEQGIEHLRGNTPDVVLLDIKLPLLNGIDVLKRMREDERTRRTPVVMLTSSTEQADIVRTYDLGANSYVRKPVEFENFVVAARQLGLYWTVLNESPEPPA